MKVDVDALITAVIEAAVVMIVLLFSTLIIITLVVLGLEVNTFIPWAGYVIIFGVLTKFFYKYEKDVNDE